MSTTLPFPSLIKRLNMLLHPTWYRNGERIILTEENFDLKRYKMLIRAWARAGGGAKSWVINKDVDKFWRKSWRDLLQMDDSEIP